MGAFFAYKPAEFMRSTAVAMDMKIIKLVF
jgi:hypothetical protein